MKGLTLERIEQVTGGTLHMGLLNEKGIFRADPQIREKAGGREEAFSPDPTGLSDAIRLYTEGLGTEVRSIVTDSRKAGEGSLFGAIVGERADGHRFIRQVFDQGALCVLAERDLTKEDLFPEEALQMAQSPDSCRRGGQGQPNCRFWIRVKDTQEALRSIAEEYLKVLKIPVVGITGSVGKTSTKEMIASVLETHFRTLKTEGNFNNGLGLPLTVFRLREDDQIAVLEMGISHFGDMDQLAKVARPDTMVITNIGTCHLEFLGDRDGVLKAKTEVFSYLTDRSHVVLNGNDDQLRTIREVAGQAPLWFGVSSDEAGTEDLSAGRKQVYPGDLDPSRLVWASDLEPMGFEGTLCTMHTPEGSFSVKVPVPGIHQVSNAASATAVGLLHGLTPEEIRRGIETMQTISGRFRILKAHDRTIIDDCYNANPVSMKSSLAVLAGAGQGSRRVAVLGDMGELGEDKVRLHRQVGEAASGSCDRLVAVGDLSRSLYEAALAKRPDLPAAWYPDAAAFLAHREEELEGGDIVLVKASHFMGFSRIVEALTK